MFGSLLYDEIGAIDISKTAKWIFFKKRWSYQ